MRKSSCSYQQKVLLVNEINCRNVIVSSLGGWAGEKVSRSIIAFASRITRKRKEGHKYLIVVCGHIQQSGEKRRCKNRVEREIVLSGKELTLLSSDSLQHDPCRRQRLFYWVSVGSTMVYGDFDVKSFHSNE
jgi:hypothetical protein